MALYLSQPPSRLLGYQQGEAPTLGGAYRVPVYPAEGFEAPESSAFSVTSPLMMALLVLTGLMTVAMLLVLFTSILRSIRLMILYPLEFFMIDSPRSPAELTLPPKVKGGEGINSPSEVDHGQALITSTPSNVTPKLQKKEQDKEYTKEKPSSLSVSTVSLEEEEKDHDEQDDLRSERKSLLVVEEGETDLATADESVADCTSSAASLSLSEDTYPDIDIVTTSSPISIEINSSMSAAGVRVSLSRISLSSTSPSRSISHISPRTPRTPRTASASLSPRVPRGSLSPKVIQGPKSPRNSRGSHVRQEGEPASSPGDQCYRDIV